MKPADLNEDLITKTYNELEKGAASGYGKKWIQFNTKNSKTVQELKQNLYRFSGAKTYQQLAEMNSNLVDENGKIRSYSEFKRKVDVVHEKYNKNYLQAEYQTAKRSAQASRQWKGYEENADLFPNLKYMTVGDERVREDHKSLNGIIKPVNDPFWDTHYPPNGWRCRCYVKPTSEASTNQKTATQPDKGFSLNVGKSNKVFNQEHPYFTFPAGDEKNVITAFENFKLLASYGKPRYLAEKANVYVSPFADASRKELIGNYKVAIKIAETLALDVKLTSHVFINNKKNPEYLINNKIADRKSPEGKTLRNLLTKANKQKVEILVIDLQNSDRSAAAVLNELAGRFRITTNYETIKEVIIVSKNRKEVTRYKRSEIKKSKK
jgi:SPP1 gp7 family putative phage head morphogenesis protein